MQLVRWKGFTAVLTLAIAAGLLAGCEVDTHKDGESKNVKIETPFGGMRVKTNQQGVAQETGLPIYPGAQPAKKESGNDDNESASVDMSFGSFHLRVLKAAFRTNDTPEKVKAFYRDGMKRFGDVIECHDGLAIGTPNRTGEGLTCDDRDGVHVQTEMRPHTSKIELKAGSKIRQHVVEIDPEDGGTKFELVGLELPGKLFSENDESNKQ